MFAIPNATLVARFRLIYLFSGIVIQIVWMREHVWSTIVSQSFKSAEGTRQNPQVSCLAAGFNDTSGAVQNFERVHALTCSEQLDCLIALTFCDSIILGMASRCRSHPSRTTLYVVPIDRR